MKIPIIERDHQAGMGGTQKIFKFKNLYGASVVQFPYSYGGLDGLWELAVIKFSGEDYEIDYTTYITDDVIGYLSETDVDDLLTKIELL